MVIDNSERIRETNKLLLCEFDSWMGAQKLSLKTRKKHVRNIDFYINTYLLNDSEPELIEAHDGVRYVSNFLGYWFIRKAMWSSPASVKENATSIKKFYTFLQEKGLVSQESNDYLKETIKEEMPEWLIEAEY